eukprot:Selendium_serpulae@DN6285_c1_g1_i7.p1
MVRQIKEIDEFSKTLNEAGDKLVVVDFTATWCPPCKRIGPVFASLESEHPGVLFLKVDVDEGAQIAEAQQVSSMPTFKYFKGGKLVDHFSGADEGRLREYIAKHKGEEQSLPPSQPTPEQSVTPFQLTPSRRQEVTQMAKDLFANMDKDGDGQVSKRELCSEVKKRKGDASEKEIAQFAEGILEEVDTDGDGKLTYAEFESALLDSATRKAQQCV